MFETTLGGLVFGLILSFFSVLTVLIIGSANIKNIKYLDMD